MAEEDDSADKTEEPTEKRIEKAREEGSLPDSTDKTHLAMLGGILVLVSFMVPRMVRDLSAVLVPFLAEPHAIPTDPERLELVIVRLLGKIALILALPIGMFTILGIVANVLQHGLVWTPSKLSPDLSRISPLKGLGRLFSMHSVVEFIKSMAKLTVIITAIYMAVMPKMAALEAMVTMSVQSMVALLHNMTKTLLVAVAIAMTVLSGADMFYQRFKHMREMRMTKTEVKDEHKMSEGDPHIKARLRRIRAERARVRMMQQVPTASVVVTNPTHYAVALLYKMEDMQAPKLVAKGADLVALRIRQVAEENEVPIVENPPLARSLFASVELDQEIPAEHYKAVAEVIGYVMRLKGTLPRRPAP
ncbi:MAG: flagellar biosynthesis protein FlhB [Alphaproteobacteria bacterium]|nr:flagellar biosynthesis protein FlhB [Alphaproteobacteria bacterium]